MTVHFAVRNGLRKYLRTKVIRRIFVLKEDGKLHSEGPFHIVLLSMRIKWEGYLTLVGKEVRVKVCVIKLQR
jgi:hypothetical protein